MGVYPRSRRGTVTFTTPQAWQKGLSPLAQGNPVPYAEPPAGAGSIPARAGEPTRLSEAPRCCRVYPRSRRGTDFIRLPLPNHAGLSPLAQGNRRNRSLVCPFLGSIPARAGEPKGGHWVFGADQVYPRSRRGTAVADVGEKLFVGLSPLAQGNLSYLTHWYTKGNNKIHLKF